MKDIRSGNGGSFGGSCRHTHKYYHIKQEDTTSEKKKCLRPAKRLQKKPSGISSGNWKNVN
jgi:hypothetical protein